MSDTIKALFDEFSSRLARPQYKVICDETNNPPELQKLGYLIVDVVPEAVPVLELRFKI